MSVASDTCGAVTDIRCYLATRTEKGPIVPWEETRPGVLPFVEFETLSRNHLAPTWGPPFVLQGGIAGFARIEMFKESATPANQAPSGTLGDWAGFWTHGRDNCVIVLAVELLDGGDELENNYFFAHTRGGEWPDELRDSFNAAFVHLENVWIVLCSNSFQSLHTLLGDIDPEHGIARALFYVTGGSTLALNTTGQGQFRCKWGEIPANDIPEEHRRPDDVGRM